MELHRIMMERAFALATQTNSRNGSDGLNALDRLDGWDALDGLDRLDGRGEGKRADIPVGAVIYRADGAVLAQAHNRVYRDADPTAHAEILAIRMACQVVGKPRLDGCLMAVTLEPCTMCAAAIGFARLSHLYFGASDAKQGAIHNGVGWFKQPSCVHRCETFGGLMEQECRLLVQDFFRQRRG